MAVSHCYTLIHALTMSEKRQFVQFSGRHVLGEENKYLTLFHILEEMPEYKPVVLQKALREKGLSAKWYQSDQNYLYHQILEHLAQFHSGKSGNLKVKESLIHIEILFDKGTFKQCRKEIEKAMAIARPLELFELMMQLLFWERKVTMATTEKGRRADAIVHDMQHCSAMIAHATTYLAMYERATALRMRVIKTRQKSDLAAFRKLLKEPLLADAEQARTTQARIRYHQIHAMWAYLQKDKAQELAHNISIIKLFDTHALLRDEYPLDYIAIYSRILAILKTGDEKTFREKLDALRAFEPDEHSIGYRNIRAQIFVQSYMIELSAYLSKNAFTDARRLIRKIESELALHGHFVNDSNRLTFMFMMSYTLFACGEYTAARSTLNQLLNDFDDTLRPDIYNFARLLSLMTHLELGNYSNIRSQAAAIAYYFKKHARLYTTENRILKYFTDPEHYKGRKQLHYLEQMESQLEKIRSASIEKYALGYIDFFTWIESRRQRMPMAHIAGRK